MPKTLSYHPIERFLYWVKKQPAAPAIIYHTGRTSQIYTYEKLNYLSDLLIEEIQKKSGKSLEIGSRVGVLFEDVPNYCVALIALWKMGHVYMPLSSEAGDDAVISRMSKTGAKLLICGENTTHSPSLDKGIIRLEWDNLNYSDPSFFKKDSKAETPYPFQCDTLNSLSKEAYVHSSSGTTGNPKIIINSFEGLAGRIEGHIERLHIRPESGSLGYTAPIFDAQLLDMLITLCSGSVLYPVTQQTRSEYYGEIVHLFTIAKKEYQRPITHAVLLPNVLASIHRANQDLTEFNTLEALVTMGSKCTAKILEPWQKIVKLIVNGYGPTEATVAASLTPICEGMQEFSMHMALPGVNFYVVKHNEEKGEITWIEPVNRAGENTIAEQKTLEGELYIGGIGIGRYLDEAEDQKKFMPVKKEFEWEKEGARIYRTGDYVSIKDNCLFFIERMDGCIKVNGRMVILSNIVDRLNEIAEIARISGVEVSVQSGQIIACVIPKKNAKLNYEKILEHIAVSPTHLKPNFCFSVNEFKKKEAGKFDLMKTLNQENTQLICREAKEEFTETEQEIAVIWESILFEDKQIKEIVKKLHNIHFDKRANFMEWGGNSISIYEMITEVWNKLIQNRQAETSIPIEFNKMILENPTIEFIAKSVEHYNRFHIERIEDIDKNDNHVFFIQTEESVIIPPKGKFLERKISLSIIKISMAEEDDFEILADLLIAHLKQCQSSGSFHLIVMDELSDCFALVIQEKLKQKTPVDITIYGDTFQIMDRIEEVAKQQSFQIVHDKISKWRVRQNLTYNNSNFFNIDITDKSIYKIIKKALSEKQTLWLESSQNKNGENVLKSVEAMLWSEYQKNNKKNPVPFYFTMEKRTYVDCLERVLNEAHINQKEYEILNEIGIVFLAFNFHRSGRLDFPEYIENSPLKKNKLMISTDYRNLEQSLAKEKWSKQKYEIITLSDAKVKDPYFNLCEPSKWEIPDETPFILNEGLYQEEKQEGKKSIINLENFEEKYAGGNIKNKHGKQRFFSDLECTHPNIAYLNKNYGQYPLFVFYPLTGDCPLQYKNLLDSFGTHQSYCIFKLVKTPGANYSMRAQAEYFSNLIEEYQTGSCILLGWSYGALLAFSVAELLESRGGKVKLVINIDCPPPEYLRGMEPYQRAWEIIKQLSHTAYGLNEIFYYQNDFNRQVQEIGKDDNLDGNKKIDAIFEMVSKIIREDNYSKSLAALFRSFFVATTVVIKNEDEIIKTIFSYLGTAHQNDFIHSLWPCQENLKAYYQFAYELHQHIKADLMIFEANNKQENLNLGANFSQWHAYTDGSFIHEVHEGDHFTIFENKNFTDSIMRKIISFQPPIFTKCIEDRVKDYLGRKEEELNPIEKIYVGQFAHIYGLEENEEKQSTGTNNSPKKIETSELNIFLNHKEKCCLLILGDPGQGKSILSKHIAIFCLQSSLWVPLFVDYSDDLNKSVREFLKKDIGITDAELDGKIIKNKKFVFIFDGDNVQQLNQEQLIKLRHSWPESKFILSCRTYKASLGQSIDSYTITYILKKFDARQIREFLEKSFPGLDKEQHDFNYHFIFSINIREILETPLILSLFYEILIASAQLSLEYNQHEKWTLTKIYTKFFQLYQEKAISVLKSEQGIPPGVDIKKAFHGYIARLAYLMDRNETRVINLILKDLDTHTIQAGKAYMYLLNDKLNFNHKTFHEYFFATYLHQHFGKPEVDQWIRQNKLNPDYQHVMRFLSGLLSTEEDETKNHWYYLLTDHPHDLTGYYETRLLYVCCQEFETEGENFQYIQEKKKKFSKFIENKEFLHFVLNTFPDSSEEKNSPVFFHNSEEVLKLFFKYIDECLLKLAIRFGEKLDSQGIIKEKSLLIEIAAEKTLQQILKFFDVMTEDKSIKININVLEKLIKQFERDMMDYMEDNSLLDKYLEQNIATLMQHERVQAFLPANSVFFILLLMGTSNVVQLKDVFVKIDDLFPIFQPFLGNKSKKEMLDFLSEKIIYDEHMDETRRNFWRTLCEERGEENATISVTYFSDMVATHYCLQDQSFMREKVRYIHDIATAQGSMNTVQQAEEKKQDRGPVVKGKFTRDEMIGYIHSNEPELLASVLADATNYEISAILPILNEYNNSHPFFMALFYKHILANDKIHKLRLWPIIDNLINTKGVTNDLAPLLLHHIENSITAAEENVLNRYQSARLGTACIHGLASIEHLDEKIVVHGLLNLLRLNADPCIMESYKLLDTWLPNCDIRKFEKKIFDKFLIFLELRSFNGMPVVLDRNKYELCFIHTNGKKTTLRLTQEQSISIADYFFRYRVSNTNEPFFSLPVKNVSPSSTDVPIFLVEEKKGEQRAWNCFDVAIALPRENLVSFALEHKKDLEFRKLLASEIKAASVVTAIMINLQDEKNEGTQDSQREKELKKLAELSALLDVADRFGEKEESEQAFLHVQEELIKLEENSDTQRLALPSSMHTKEIQQLVNAYNEAHEVIKSELAACNSLLGHPNGKRLSLSELRNFFALPANCAQYEAAFRVFEEALKKFTPHEKAFQNYCESEAVYERYINDYYGNKQWASFIPANGGKQNTSIVDIAARCLNKKIIIHQLKGNQHEEIYRTEDKGNGIIHIQYHHARRHFVALKCNPAYFITVEAELLTKFSFLKSQSTSANQEIQANVQNTVANQPTEIVLGYLA